MRVDDVADFGAAGAAVRTGLQRFADGRKDTVVIIYADAGASHQAVVNVLESARLAGLSRVTFAAQSGAASSR